MQNAFITRGNACLRAGEHREALFFYQQALDTSPELADIAEFNRRWVEKHLLRPAGQTLASLSAPFAFLSDGSYSTKLATLGGALAAKKITRHDLETQFYRINTAKQAVTASSPPLISVIMPTFNRADILLDSVLTVLQQSYAHFELLVCDDGSTDTTKSVIASLNDPRIKYLYQAKQGAAAARNLGLRHAQGELFTYLDTDNFWHPDYLQLVCSTFLQQPGQLALYFDFVDFKITTKGDVSVLSTKRPRFSHERLIEKPFIDLNTFAHKRELYELFGGFDESLSRRQDYDVILKYTWLQDPLHVPLSVGLYQRNENFEQITRAQKDDYSPVTIIDKKVAGYFNAGLPLCRGRQKLKVSVLIWDRCRNHFSKAYAVAEALAAVYEVELIAFDFFDEGVFAPLQQAKPPFSVKYLPGADFPDFFATMRQALDAITGDVLYVVKPRLPSMGLALLANYERALPFVLEINDLETVVNQPNQQRVPVDVSVDEVDVSDDSLTVPYADNWSFILDPLAKQLPFIASHNKNLNAYYHHNTMMMRNIKDEAVYNPANYNRDAVRQALGFAKDDRVILFGGLIRKHKGVFELVELIQRLNDSRYKVLFVASRTTPDQRALLAQYGDTIKILPSQDREGMAKINFAADLVILWLNPQIVASHYQFPYKATDAFAMETPVIANDISDLGELATQGYLTQVPFGDWQRMEAAIKTLFEDEAYRSRQVAAARRLFLRQFSYCAARSNFELMLQRIQKQPKERYVASATFAGFFEKFYQARTGKKGFLAAGQ